MVTTVRYPALTSGRKTAGPAPVGGGQRGSEGAAEQASPEPRGRRPQDEHEEGVDAEGHAGAPGAIGRGEHGERRRRRRRPEGLERPAAQREADEGGEGE